MNIKLTIRLLIVSAYLYLVALKAKR